MVSLQKVTLQKSGDRAPLSLEKKGDGFSSVRVSLAWTAGVDLDLHAFYRTKAGEEGHISFANKGQAGRPPFIRLSGDEGVGNTAGDNEERLVIERLDHLDTVLIATHIFRFFGFLHKGDNFAKYDGRVTVRPGEQSSVEVPLTSSDPGRWCVIAKIDNTGAAPEVVNINRTQKGEPELAAF
jgi:tellurite resistance protein TerA